MVEPPPWKSTCSGTTPAEFSKQIVDEIAKMKKVAAYARIQID